MINYHQAAVDVSMCCFMLIQKIISLLIILLITFVTHSETSMPIPNCYLTVNLTNPPPPVTLILHNIHLQEGLVNSAFRFNLQPFVSELLPEITYRVTHVAGPQSKDITSVSMVSMGLSGIPDGFVQISNNAGDCAAPFTLTPYASCLLHFYVDQSKFVSLQGGNGPIISTHISWLWGSRKNRDGGKNIITAAMASQSITNVFSSIVQPVRLIVEPMSQDGLYYDESTGSILGVPTRTGLYTFNLIATNGLVNSDSGVLNIMVNLNPKNTPLFKPYYFLASATPQSKYFLNLNDLIELIPEDATTSNPVSFHIIASSMRDSCMHIDAATGRTLQGMPLESDAGTIQELTIIATSNTGGDSLPMTFAIPVATDAMHKPIIADSITLNVQAGAYFQIDLREHIKDQTDDDHLQIILESIKPSIYSVSISRDNPTLLEGFVPVHTAGQIYEITLHANSTSGGNSISVTIPLQVDR